jgi:uncharacterized protein YcgI (DUF1989 family)
MTHDRHRHPHAGKPLRPGQPPCAAPPPPRRRTLPARSGQGQTLRIVDLEGNQAADVIFYNRHDLAEHYSATDTLLRQGGIYLTTGSVLYTATKAGRC